MTSLPSALPSSSRRQPLGELPLHLFVAQSLQADNLTPPPAIKPTSRASSRSVSPHKQAVLQHHHHNRTTVPRPGSSSSSVTSSPTASPTHSPADKPQNHSDTMTTLEATPVRRRLFPSHSQSPSGSVPLEYSPILPSAPRYVKVPASVTHSLANMNTPVKPKTPTGSSVPATPTDAPTTPKNLRLHRPHPVSGPKPKDRVEPSPSVERHIDSFLQARLASAKKAGIVSRPTTPVIAQPTRISSSGNGTEEAAVTDGIDDVEVAGDSSNSSASPSKASALKSLPKKKFRVSKTEIAIAHEIAGSGPMGSPSPCKVASFSSSDGYFAARSQSESRCADAIPRARRANGSPRRRSQPLANNVDEYALPEAINNDVFSSAHLRRLSASNLFADIKRNAQLNWSIYEDPTVDSKMTAAMEPPTQDVDVPGLSPGNMTPVSVPSTPNKENKRPRAEVEGSPLPSSPARLSARKRGTGGRLSLLAKAGDDGAVASSSITFADGGNASIDTTSLPPKKSKLDVNQPSVSPVVLAPRSPEMVRGRTPRKASGASPAITRKAAAVVASAAQDGVASRTRSKARTAH